MVKIKITRTDNEAIIGRKKSLTVSFLSYSYQELSKASAKNFELTEDGENYVLVYYHGNGSVECHYNLDDGEIIPLRMVIWGGEDNSTLDDSCEFEVEEIY